MELIIRILDPWSPIQLSQLSALGESKFRLLSLMTEDFQRYLSLYLWTR